MTDTIIDIVRRRDDPYRVQREERKRLIEEIQVATGCRVVVLYHNTDSQHAYLDDGDARFLGQVLSSQASNKRTLLIIESDGGLPLAAERLVYLVRTYSPRGFCSMVVRKAKSAATMICLGSDKIFMLPTAELGPIDPQIYSDAAGRWVSADSLIDAYDSLMDELRQVDMSKENPAGMLQQLQRFDASFVEEIRKTQQLGRDMTQKFLSTWMLKGAKKAQITNVVNAFAESKKHKSHGRPVWPQDALDLGLKIEIVSLRRKLWKSAYELIVSYDRLLELDRMYDGRTLIKSFETATTHHSTREGA